LLIATTPTATHTLSLHDALPISVGTPHRTGTTHRISPGGYPARTRSSRATCTSSARVANKPSPGPSPDHPPGCACRRKAPSAGRSEEHTSELQSRSDLVCRLLLE